MSRIARFIAVIVLSLSVPAGAAGADPVIDFIMAADSVLAASGNEGLASWLPDQPDLAGAAVAQLIDIAVQLGDEGNAGVEAENIVLVEAMVAAHVGMKPDSATSVLLAEYRNWDGEARAARQRARQVVDDAALTAWMVPQP